MQESKTRLTPEELAIYHDIMCAMNIGDGSSCTCLVARVIDLQADVDRLKLERRGFQIMARKLATYSSQHWEWLMDDGKYERCAGDAECSECRHVYLEHPQLEGFPTFHVTCNGKIVKL
jgi:hypothetical protein